MLKKGLVGDTLKELSVLCFKIASAIPDELYLQLIYLIRMKKRLDLKNPKRFNEKIQWLKIHDRNPLYTIMADKYEVRNYVSDKIGGEYLIPLIGVYNHFDEIDFSKVPDEFVMKCTHDSGGLVICRDKNKLDYKKTKRRIEKCLKRNFFWKGREWPYKDIKPRIIIEKYMSDSNVKDGRAGLTDYKFYCFNGVPKYLYVSRGLEDHATANISFYTMDFEPAEFCRRDYKVFSQKVEKPEQFADMEKIACTLSEGMAFARIDMYVIDGQIYFSEITLHPVSGFMPFKPDEWDEMLGEMIDLNIVKKKF